MVWKVFSNAPKRMVAALSNLGLDKEQFDVRAHHDSRLSYRENKANIRKLAHIKDTPAEMRRKYGVKVARKTKLDDFYRQTGKSVKRLDAALPARKPGPRKSKKSGRMYTERRKNRSDRPGSDL